MVPTLFPFLLSFPPLRKTEWEKQHEKDALPRFKKPVHSEKHPWFEGQFFSNNFSTGKTRDVCLRLNTTGVTKLCIFTSLLLVLCFTLASLGSNPDNSKTGECTERAVWSLPEQGQLWELEVPDLPGCLRPWRSNMAGSLGGGWESNELHVTDL